MVTALLLEGLLGEDVPGAEERERSRALGDHRSPDEGCAACVCPSVSPVLPLSSGITNEGGIAVWGEVATVKEKNSLECMK